MMMIKGSKVNEVKVSVKFDKRTTKTTIKIGDKKFVTGKTGTAMEAVVIYHFRKATGMKLPFSEIMGSVAVTEAKKSKFGINQRFEFVTQLVSMVADSVQPSAIITGEGGLGKTYTVIKTLEAKGYTDISDLAEFQVGATMNMKKCFTTVKGYSTAKEDPIALNLLKSALDSYGKRIISWNADMKDDDLPRSFNFEGRIIFISNLDEGKIDQALRSRSMMIDLTMDTEQKIERMSTIAASPDFLPEYDKGIIADALVFIRTIKDDCKELSLRTLIQVAKCRAANKNWKSLAEYMLTA